MCGISGIINKYSKSSIHNLLRSLFHLQHRGQDSCGIHTCDEKKLYIIKGKGLINSVFNNNNINKLKGFMGIGHNRYPTNGTFTVDEIQPFYIQKPFKVSLCHNGNIYNTNEIISYLENKNIYVHTKSDSELVLMLISFELDNELLSNNNETISFEDSITNVIKKVSLIIKGAYGIILMIKDYGLVAFKDPNGIRPLLYGETNNEVLVASESISLQSLNFKNIQNVQNGEIIFINKHKITKRIYNQSLYTPCIFEYVYISRVESIIDNVSVYKSRQNMGKYLAKTIKEQISQELINEIDFVASVPDTSRPTAIEISKSLDLPYNEVLIKNRYICRTFIMNNQEDRCSNIKKKFGVIKELAYNKNILLVDDSIVRGNTMKHTIELLKSYGCKKIYVAISCPIIKYTNHYGIDYANAR